MLSTVAHFFFEMVVLAAVRLWCMLTYLSFNFTPHIFKLSIQRKKNG